MTAITSASGPAALDLLAPQVRSLLLGAPAYRQLAPEEQRQIANAMVKIFSYMADPGGVLASDAEAAARLVARPQAGDPAAAARPRMSPPGHVAPDLQPASVKLGVEQFRALAQEVGFPKFVSDLIGAVFQAIVDSSIQQMGDYAELLADVAATVDDFVRDTITDGNACDWLTAKYPDMLAVEAGSGAEAPHAGGAAAARPTSRLAAWGHTPQHDLGRISGDLEVAPPMTDLSDPAQEQRLVDAARRALARSRQQLLATMVLMGINRIAATGGSSAPR